MTPRHRRQPVKTGGAVRRAVVTSVLSALALTSVTITAAAVTLADAEPKPQEPAAAPPPTTATTSEDDYSLAPPVDIPDAPIGIPEVAVISDNGPVLADIPTVALAAYQRAESVLNGADKSCHLDWTLVAAVGQVVSKHGAKDGGTFRDDGTLRPHLRGDPITDDAGKKLPDSDAGKVDGDKRWDRPVGPMQLAPPTWAVIGVDADGDGRRNPGDIDDASLAVAVLLCSGEEDLQKRADRMAAVGRINDDKSFVETVLAVDRAYQDQTADSLAADPTIIADFPTDLPTDFPTDLPTESTDPTSSSATPSATPSDLPGSEGTFGPTWSPSPTDTGSPTSTGTPSDTPTDCPSMSDSMSPSATPSDAPSLADPCVTDSPSASDSDSSSPTG
ncbi:hypothetical protein [Nocardioides sp. MH1]|uniref:hypothetical protein n=1 Tax=Nocardioides sp. MH1 TaxID=3242490 RepID=UPI00351FE916